MNIRRLSRLPFRSLRLTVATVLLNSTALIAATPAYAAEAADETGDQKPAGDQSDIVVTAERRETRLQTTPISIGVVGGDRLNDQGVTNIRQLSGVVAGLQTSPSTSIIGYAYIRGIGSQLSSFQSPVAIYIDDVMWARQMNNAAFSLPDVERVEVLRGPQGTLYGLNSSAGAIRIISRKPDDTTRGSASISLGNNGLFKGSAYYSGPIVEGVLAASIAYSHEETGGYTYNETLGKKVNAIRNDQARFKLRLTPPSIEGLEAVLSVQVLRDRSDSPAYAPLNIANPQPYVTYDSVDPETRNNTYAGSLTVSYDLDDKTTVRSISGYRTFKARNPWSISGLATPIFYWENDPHQSQISQEIQSTSDFGRLTLSTGAVYFHEIFKIVRNANSLGSFSGVDSRTVSDSFGLYAQGRYAITPELGVTVGARYYNQRDKFDIEGYSGTSFGDRATTTFVANGLRQSTDGVTPKIGVDWKASDDIFAYASLTTGVKAGGYWPTSGSASAAALSLKPEKVTTYEAGIKTSSFDKRLTVNVSAFYNDFKNLQTQVGNVVFNGVLVSGSVTLNAQKARTYGVEAEIVAKPTDRLTLEAAGSLLKAKFVDFTVQQTTGALSFNDNELPAVSPVNVTGRISYEVPLGTFGSLFLRGEVQHLSSTYSTIFNTLKDPAQTYINADARLATVDRKWELFAIVRNLANKNNIIAQSGTGVPGINSAIYIPPRSVEVGVRTSF